MKRPQQISHITSKLARASKLAGAILLSVSLAAITFSQTVTFSVVGDTGDASNGSKDITAIANQMANYRATKTKFDFVLLLGDNIYPDGVGQGLPTHFETPFKGLLDAGVKFYAALGNHDIRKGTDIQINYPLFNMGGRRFYSFTMGGGLVEFFALDSTPLSNEAEELVEANLKRLTILKATTLKNLANLQLLSSKPTVNAAIANQDKKLQAIESKIEESNVFLAEMRKTEADQLKWLESALPLSAARWKIVFLHHSIFSSAYKAGGHGKENKVLALRKLLHPKFVQGKVDVVFAGHDHVFEKTKPQDNIIYMTSGNGSERRAGDLDKKSSFFDFGDDLKHSFLVVTVSANQLQINVLDKNGMNIVPQFQIQKP